MIEAVTPAIYDQFSNSLISLRIGSFFPHISGARIQLESGASLLSVKVRSFYPFPHFLFSRTHALRGKKGFTRNIAHIWLKISHFTKSRRNLVPRIHSENLCFPRITHHASFHVFAQKKGQSRNHTGGFPMTIFFKNFDVIGKKNSAEIDYIFGF